MKTGPKKILVVDDDPEIVDLYIELFRNAGYEVLVAEAGWEALVTVQNVRPDLAIVDLCIPGIDGYEVCKEILKGALTSDVPVLVVSALDDEKSRRYVQGLGARDYITKPFSPGDLLARVDEILRPSEGV